MLNRHGEPARRTWRGLGHHHHHAHGDAIAGGGFAEPRRLGEIRIGGAPTKDRVARDAEYLGKLAIGEALGVEFADLADVIGFEGRGAGFMTAAIAAVKRRLNLAAR
ncbi:hypothetical protein [Sphingomonas sp. So64.6b]|uniref:hypothetical protein n=1 Tax=Sphingomonas sp. So64.6b TaxID=2997354 RepID=UPI001FCEFD15|nr:hypothetical protein [Sphingomonas sp. So64.6b]